MFIKYFEILSMIALFMGIVAFVLGKATESMILLILTIVIGHRIEIEKIKRGNK